MNPKMLSSTTVQVCATHATVQGRPSLVSVGVQQEAGPAPARSSAMTPCDPQEVLVSTPQPRGKGGRGGAGPEGAYMTSTPVPFDCSPDVAERTKARGRLEPLTRRAAGQPQTGMWGWGSDWGRRRRSGNNRQSPPHPLKSTSETRVNKKTKLLFT